MDHISQLGFVILLSDKFHNANIPHCASIRSKRVTRSMLAADLSAAVMVYDYASTLKVAMNAIFGRILPLALYADSRSLHDVIVRMNMTTEKRQLIDLCLLRQSCEVRDLPDVLQIPSAQNPADAMTKETAWRHFSSWCIIRRYNWMRDRGLKGQKQSFLYSSDTLRSMITIRQVLIGIWTHNPFFRNLCILFRHSTTQDDVPNFSISWFMVGRFNRQCSVRFTHIVTRVIWTFLLDNYGTLLWGYE